MDDKEKDRMKRFESALSDPLPSQMIFGAPRPPEEHEPPNPVEQTVASLVEQVRTQVRTLNALCDDIDAVITASEEHARKAADNLMDLIKRVK
jgi:hypothetical protein